MITLHCAYALCKEDEDALLPRLDDVTLFHEDPALQLPGKRRHGREGTRAIMAGVSQGVAEETRGETRLQKPPAPGNTSGMSGVTMRIRGLAK